MLKCSLVHHSWCTAFLHHACCSQVRPTVKLLYWTKCCVMWHKPNIHRNVGSSSTALHPSFCRAEGHDAVWQCDDKQRGVTEWAAVITREEEEMGVESLQCCLQVFSFCYLCHFTSLTRPKCFLPTIRNHSGCSQSAVSFMLNPRHHTGGGRLERCPKVKPKHPDGLLVVGCSKGHEDVSFCLTSWVGLTPGPHFNSYKNIVHTTLVKKIRIKTLGQVWRTEWNMMFMCWQQITPETASGLWFGALGNLPENKWNSPSVHIFYNVLYQAAKCINYNITRTIYSLCPWWTYWQISCDLRSKLGSVYLVTHSHAVSL